MNETAALLWQELIAGVRYARTSSILIATDVTQGDEAYRHRQKVIEGVLFSTWFIKTYHAVLCAIVLGFAVWHWTGTWLRHRRRRQHFNKKSTAPSSSSSSSIVEGTSTPPSLWNVPTERSRLLTSQLSNGHAHATSSIMRRIRAIGIYQPPNLPVLNKILPSNRTSLLILFLFGLNLFYAFYNISVDIDSAFILGDRMALLFIANLPWLYILGAKNQPVKVLTGYSYESLNILHRRLGEWMCLLVIFHFAGTTAAWYYFFRPNGMTIWMFLGFKIIRLGMAAFVCYEVLYLTSLAAFRQWWYELFLASHIVLQAAALGVVFFHHPGARVCTATAIAIFLIDWVLYRMILKARTVRADLVVMGDGQTVMIAADWPLVSRWASKATAFLGSSLISGWRPTEHVFISIPALAKKHVFQTHPFTIASAAPEGQEHAWFNLIIRAQDGFTGDLLHYAKTHSFVNVRLDGPYGSMHALEMLRSADVAVLVVGGSGIAVAYPLLWTVLHRGDVERDDDERKVGLIWIVHEASHLDWIGHDRLDELKQKGLVVCIPAPTSKAGRPDVADLMTTMVTTLAAGSLVQDPKVGVVVSGPDSMNRSARNACTSLSWQGTGIEVAVEKYGW